MPYLIPVQLLADLSIYMSFIFGFALLLWQRDQKRKKMSPPHNPHLFTHERQILPDQRLSGRNTG